MKIIINYLENGVLKNKQVRGNMDYAYRQIITESGVKIHTAKGRLTIDQFVQRCLKHGITITRINANDVDKYLDESRKEQKQEQKKGDSKRVEANRAESFKYMNARYSGKCHETGKAISKSDLCLYNKVDKVIYHRDSNMFKTVIDNYGDRVYGYGLLIETEDTEGAKKTEQKQERSQKSSGRVEVKSSGDSLIDEIANRVADQITASDIDQDQVNEMIETALSKHSKTLVIKKPDMTEKEIGKQHYAFEDLLTSVSCRLNTLLIGSAGSGKTYSASEVAKVLDLAFYAISVGGMTTKTDFFGYMNAEGVYVWTLFRKAYEEGGVFLLDELDAGNANVLTMINMALSSDECAFPNGMAKKHEDFVLIACANTYGLGADRQYVGRNQLDAATLDRFVNIDWNYDEEIELAISPNNRWTKYVQQVRANLNRLKLRYVVSPRASINGGKLLAAGMSFDKVCKMTLFNGMKEGDITNLKKGANY